MKHSPIHLTRRGTRGPQSAVLHREVATQFLWIAPGHETVSRCSQRFPIPIARGCARMSCRVNASSAEKKADVLEGRTFISQGPLPGTRFPRSGNVRPQLAVDAAPSRPLMRTTSHARVSRTHGARSPVFVQSVRPSGVAIQRTADRRPHTRYRDGQATD